MPVVRFDALPDDARAWVFGAAAPVTGAAALAHVAPSPPPANRDALTNEWNLAGAGKGTRPGTGATSSPTASPGLRATAARTRAATCGEAGAYRSVKQPGSEALPDSAGRSTPGPVSHLGMAPTGVGA